MSVLDWAEFVEAELGKRTWNRSRLSRETGLPKSTISKVMNGTAYSTYNICKQISLAFSQTSRLGEEPRSFDDYMKDLTSLMDASRKYELKLGNKDLHRKQSGRGELQTKILEYILQHPYSTVIEISLGMDKPSGLIGKTLSGLFYLGKTYSYGKLKRRRRGINKTREYWID